MHRYQAFHYSNKQRLSQNFHINANVWVKLIYSNLATLPVARQKFKHKDEVLLTRQ